MLHPMDLGQYYEAVVKWYIYKATDFQEVLIKAHKVRSRLDSLGCFRNIAVFIDTSKGPTASPDGLEITFQVKELRRVVGGVSTHVGNNEGSLVVGLKAPNLFGRGERFQVEYSHGSQGTHNFNVAFIKPLKGRHTPLISTSIYKQSTEWPPSGYKENDMGVCFDLGFNSLPLIKHNIQWIGAIRNISVLGRGSAFEVREESGPNLKSALRHILSVDLRDELIFPSCGTLFQLTTEFAGLGGNVGFLKNDAYLQTNYSIAEDFVSFFFTN
ncbi:sorting and assembly machinery component 50 homolog B-like [Agrilus planipennis]|uniref:Sorting and assembly machinery component 50 homolog B-like n=1 Tax=Agrilus planipennis TaxID=224129 RepID=A0A7F5QVY8_AGRPL|nr:sorting and assembly machinery component 50 homolog B-like [Agrilus planipennis]